MTSPIIVRPLRHNISRDNLIMPVRSTLLQRVIFHIQRQLTANATVQESALLPDQSSGSNREVDVVIRSRVGEHEVIVCVECQDHQRRATVEWVEQMAMKHSSLATSKLILVSAKGFSRAAGVKAAALGIDTYSFDEAVEADWAALLGEGAELSFTMWAFRILGCGLVFTLGEAIEYPASPKIRIFNSDGTSRGTLNDVVRANTERSDSFTEQMTQYAGKTTETVIGAELKIHPLLFAEDDHAQRHEIKAIRVYLEARKVPSVRLTAARYRGAPVAYAAGQSPAGEFAITLFQPPHAPTTGAMSVTDPETGNVQTVDVRFPVGHGKLAFVAGPTHSKPHGGAAQQDAPETGRHR